MIKTKLQELTDVLEQNIDFEKEYPLQTPSEWISDWEFSKSNIKTYSHKISDYPATFVPQLVRKLIKEYSKEGETVLDIFSGSGTSLVEGLVLNRNTIGIDLNPFAILLSKVKTTKVDTSLIVKEYTKMLQMIEEGLTKTPLKSFKNINEWFDEVTIQVFSFYYDFIFNKIDDEDIRDIFKIAFSSIIRKLSYCNHSGFKMHKSKSKLDKINEIEHIYLEFHKSLLIVSQGVNSIQNTTANVKIIHGNSQKVNINQKVDFIITSPPYGDSKTTVAYGQFSRLQSQWLNLIAETEQGTIENVDKELLGGSIKDIDLDDAIIYKSNTLYQLINSLKFSLDLSDRKNINRIKDVISFYKDLYDTVENSQRFLKDGKKMAWVVSSRTVKNHKTNIDLIIAEFAENFGFTLETIMYRKIPNKRVALYAPPTGKSGDTLVKTMDMESILILKKLS